jgi:hypothetical protein
VKEKGLSPKSKQSKQTHEKAVEKKGKEKP